MKVKKLIELLSQQNPEANVLIYSWEDFNEAEGVTSKNENKPKLYCKGYSFKEYEEEYPNSDYIIIHD